ncbi:uncharacterized protein LTHEOB_13031 [Lasiodiplodia theobromae]|uniref:uncharacterized protein n=1 Tax=Lasiodiplodia theobromae TaxID=45133 RepID=UPI0015C32581|nr:uncharacterized protein LTHEOB_13031 [Lasiodiplodia theobromae]KAF4546825.1 hypothetical protein LTHEOB_13031 [Lasiodiplodia theobromae]
MQPPKFFRKSQDYAGIEQTDNLLPTDEKTPTNTRRRLPYNIFFYTSIALLNIVVGLLIGYLAASEESASSSDSIYLEEPARYGLQDPGIHAPFFIFSEPPAAAADAANVNNFYVLNNLHQIHCVNMIRMRYNSLVYHRDATDPLARTPIDEDWIRHLEHCFEYLRLSITCADYLTFESDSPPGSPEEYWKDGLSWGVVHSCVDWDALMGWQRSQVVAYNATWS